MKQRKLGSRMKTQGIIKALDFISYIFFTNNIQSMRLSKGLKLNLITLHQMMKPLLIQKIE